MGTGMLQGIGHYFLVSAFIHGEAVVVAPFRYFAMLWATIYGYLMFDDIPGLATITGAAIVIGSGLFIFYREARRGGQR
jgi:drug/metabolite transporter (DMT)-like permease